MVRLGNWVEELREMMDGGFGYAMGMDEAFLWCWVFLWLWGFTKSVCRIR